jgi:hypothetical protein
VYPAEVDCQTVADIIVVATKTSNKTRQNFETKLLRNKTSKQNFRLVNSPSRTVRSSILTLPYRGAEWVGISTGFQRQVSGFMLRVREIAPKSVNSGMDIRNESRPRQGFHDSPDSIQHEEPATRDGDRQDSCLSRPYPSVIAHGAYQEQIEFGQSQAPSDVLFVTIKDAQAVNDDQYFKSPSMGCKEPFTEDSSPRPRSPFS